MKFAQLSFLPVLMVAGCQKAEEPEKTAPPAHPPGKLGLLGEGNRLLKRMQALEGRALGLTGGFDAVLGPRSSKIDLVVQNFLFLGSSPGLVGSSDFQMVSNHPAVAHAVPIAMADSYRRFRLVGTMRELFEVAEWAPGKKHALAEGRLFAADRMEAVLGGRVARELGFKLEDRFNPQHGLAARDGEDAHETEVVVVGILEETQTPFDVAIWVPLAAVQNMDGHAAKASGDMNAVYLKWKQPPNPVIVGRLVDYINAPEGNLTIAWPAAGLLQVGVREKVGMLGGVEFWVREVESRGVSGDQNSSSKE